MKIEPISFQEAKAKVEEYLMEHLRTAKEKKAGTTVTLHTWGNEGEPTNNPFFGVRVAEVSLHTKHAHGSSGSTYMQVDMPWGIAYCAQAERCIIQLMEGVDDPEYNFIEEEFDRLGFLIQEDQKDAQKPPK